MLPTTSSCLVTLQPQAFWQGFVGGTWTPVKNGAALFLFLRVLVISLPQMASQHTMVICMFSFFSGLILFFSLPPLLLLGTLEMCCVGRGKEDVASFLYKGGWGACLPACLPTRPVAIYPVLEELTKEFRVTKGRGVFQGQRDGSLLLMASLHSSSPWGLLGFLFLESQC